MFGFEKRNDKPVIIAIHGFGRRRIDEYNNLLTVLKDYEVIRPYLFDQTKSTDVYWFNWVSKAEEELVKAKKAHKKVVLIGFSMGGVIATYLASKFQVEQLILLAPAFEYLNLTTVQGAVFKKSKIDDLRYPDLPLSFTQVFMDVVNNCKDAINHISCPVTFFHCINDEVIPYTVSVKYYKKVPHDNKRLILYGDGQHRILDDDKNKDLCLKTIQELLRNIPQ